MNLMEKFNQCFNDRGYQRIDSEYNVNIFLGYNDNGQMSMVITEFGKHELIKSSKLINISLRKRKDNRLALTFDLLDDSYKSMFVVFCRDLILYCEKAGADMAISTAIRRWKYWKDMFGSKKNNNLSKAEIKGLVGELLVLRDYFMKKWSVSDAIQSWMGPLMGHKDFEIEKTWYEVKSVSENAVQVQISSLEQLESDVYGHLVVVRLEETSNVNDLSINLNYMVSNILKLIDDIEDMNLFQSRLDNIGYTPNSEYDDYNFIFKGRQIYYISDDFPRLRRKDLHPSIGNTSYTILLDGIVEYKEV